MRVNRKHLVKLNRLCRRCSLSQDGGTFCRVCGDELQEVAAWETLTCAQCGTPLRAGTTFCSACGKGLIPRGLRWTIVSSLLWVVGVCQAFLLFWAQRIGDRFATKRRRG